MKKECHYAGNKRSGSLKKCFPFTALVFLFVTRSLYFSTLFLAFNDCGRNVAINQIFTNQLHLRLFI